MSYMKCKRVKNNHDGTITIHITENNVYPADWRDYTIKSDDKGLAQDKLVTLMYYGDVQLQASAKKYGLGKAIEKAIEIAGGRKWDCDDGITTEEEKETLRKAQLLSYTKLVRS